MGLNFNGPQEQMALNPRPGLLIHSFVDVKVWNTSRKTSGTLTYHTQGPGFDALELKKTCSHIDLFSFPPQRKKRKLR